MYLAVRALYAKCACNDDKEEKLSRLSEALLEMAADLHQVGMMDDASYREIIIRHLGPNVPEVSKLDQRQNLRG